MKEDAEVELGFRVLIGLGICVLSIAFARLAYMGVVAILSTAFAPDSSLDEFLSGKATFSLTSIEVSGQRRRFVCTNHEALKSIEAELRNATCPPPFPSAGYAYNFTFGFSNGRRITVCGQVYGQMVAFHVPGYISDPGVMTHGVECRTDSAGDVQHMLQFLSMPNPGGELRMD